MIHFPIGTVQLAKVIRKIDTGYVLGKETDEVLLHHNETESELEIDDEVEVFLYNDKNNQIVATTIIPNVRMDAYDWGDVVEVIPDLGVFVNIGIAKEMLISIDDLPLFEDVWPKIGDRLYVTLGLDQNGRLLAIPATEGIFMAIRESAFDVELNTSISGRVFYTSREGTAIFSDEGYRGFIHHTERDSEPRLGELVQGRVIDIKEDGTLNLSLLPLKEERMDDDADRILHALNENNGMIPYGDKSSADDIRAEFQMSKSAFKRALGRLMKQRKIKQQDGNTYLTESNP